MKYFIDTEFLEGTQAKKILGFKIGYTKPTIDLISIGIVNESGDKYQAVSKDFNLREAWDRHEINEYGERVYWIRDNVLKPIWKELISYRTTFEKTYYDNLSDFSYKGMKYLIKCYGKRNKVIAQEINEFICSVSIAGEHLNGLDHGFTSYLYQNPPQFYGYYSDYDWVAFCWLYGKMIDLPNGFPMYCIDLKQMSDERGVNKNQKGYPPQYNEHHALADAMWNKDLYDYLVKI